MMGLGTENKAVDLGDVLREALAFVTVAGEWIRKAPHLPGCKLSYGRIMGEVPRCSCGKTELVGEENVEDPNQISLPIGELRQHISEFAVKLREEREP